MPNPPTTAEAPILTLQPAAAFIILRRAGLPILIIACALLALRLIFPAVFPFDPLTSPLVPIIIILLVLVWSALVRLAERYTLTPSAVIWESGVFRRLRVELPLGRIQTIVIYRSIGERLFGLGTVGIGSAATDAYEVVWSMIADPSAAVSAIRAASSPAAAASESTPAPRDRPPVIGLAGGIGSGKSTVGAILSDLGCLVIDSDQRARAALDRPDVRDQLVMWWGTDILTAPPNPRIDRAKVARIIFADPQQRERLEGLVHPIVRQDRAALIAEAAAVGGPPPRAIVIDAPLLFEAGLDKECDAVFFIDAPREDRLARVQASRGWDDAELARREQAQWPADQKKGRATTIIANGRDIDPPALAAAVAHALDRVAPRP